MVDKKEYYGTKRITAWPEVKESEGGAVIQAGYAVEYNDGYISWSPKDVFEKAYQPIDAMNFSHALQAIKDGHKVARKGWNGKEQFVFLIKASQYQRSLGFGFGEYLGEPEICSGLAIKTSKNEIQMGWLASQADMLADDWRIV